MKARFLHSIFQLVCILLLLHVGSEAKTVRLLTIGNSFANNALAFLPDLAEASGHTLIIGRANLGGCTLERHWRHAAIFKNNPSDPEGSPYSNGQYSLVQLLEMETWDAITLQQVSWKSHDLNSYYPYITDLYYLIREHAPDSQLYVHQIWAYRVDDPRFVPENEGIEPHSHEVMYRQVRQAYHSIAKAFGMKILPSGDAMYLADIDPEWGYKPDSGFDPEQAVYPELPDQTHSLHTGWRWRQQKDDGYELNIDGHHANEAGEYLLGCVWFETFFNESAVENRFTPPGMDPDYARFLQNTAHQAVEMLKTKQSVEAAR